ncbi:MAG: phosphotransferase family protein [Gammaproteobacteria bacterium]|nr:MAG: phosphotransferase family protein [Gammaproteobacteria bacterium]RLA52062.1 MAG: phosphotransferase family protein [Gammaproteobacteria bacterium]
MKDTSAPGSSDTEVSAQLAEEVIARFGGGLVENVEKLSGGASCETWSFDWLDDAGNTTGLILRRDLGKTGSTSEKGWRGGKTAYSLDRTTEAELQRVVYDAGGLVARVHFALPEDHKLGGCYVMDRIEGETLAPRILRDETFADARRSMAYQCGEILAKLHGIDSTTLPRGMVQVSARELIAQQREMMDGISDYYRDETAVARPEYHPAFELTLRWLEQHCPKDATAGLVHGDFRNGNFVVGPEGIRAVLDWEIAHVGDGMEDLGWVCVRAWRFGQHQNPVGGFGQREDLFAAYENAGGRRVDPKVVHFWEVLGSLKWGIGCMFQTYKPISGLVDSFEHLAIGRRASENEIDLLALLEESP